MYKHTKQTNRNNRMVQQTRRHYHPKVSKNSDAQIKDTGPIVFDMPEIEAQEIDGNIVIKMGGHIVDRSQIPQQIETYYREFDAACKEYVELAEPL